MADDELSAEDLDAILKRITESDATLDKDMKGLKDESGDVQNVASNEGLKKGLDEVRKARGVSVVWRHDTASSNDRRIALANSPFAGENKWDSKKKRQNWKR